MTPVAHCASAALAAAAALGSLHAAAARNVILFVGDGMGVSTVTAARILEGQRRGEPGEENYLSFEKFPHLALVKTYNVDAQVPDSAGTMTALIAGRKTRAGVLSVGPEVPRGDCAASLDGQLSTLLEEAEQQRFGTGIVSTARITHATPAAAYAHSPERGWEYDAAVPSEQQACKDIARQLVEFEHGDGVDVVLGGGRGMFLTGTTPDPENADRAGARRDGRNLVEQWLAAASGRRYVYDQAGFDALADGERPRQVLGLFEESHMEFEADRDGDTGGEPSLAEMTRFAIDHLAQPMGDAAEQRGFLLIVEGGRIDHAHHAGNAYRALTDTLAFADAVAVAALATDARDTLIIVTADHSHTLTIAGYPARGNPILGYAVGADGEPGRDLSGDAYTTLGYANGPGALRDADESLEPTHPEYRQRATHLMGAETHAGEDVPAYARGPGAEQVSGVMDQHELHGVMRQALFGSAPAQ